MKLLKFLIFLILPITLFCTLYISKKSHLDFHTGYNSDPSYVYLINSVNLAYGRVPGHVDHPGTILQYCGAFILRIAYLIDGKENTLAEDVLTYPEKYLDIISFSVIFLNAFISLLIGWLAYRYTQRIWLGIYLQITPFLFLHLLAFNVPRVAAESLLWIHTIIISFYCILYYIKDENFLDSKKHIWGFSLAVISGIITKITFAPFGLLPFLFLKKKSSKVYYVVVCLLLFVFLAMPALFSYEYLFHWIIGLFIKSGHYNSGEANFMIVSHFKENIKNLFEYQKPCFITAVLSIMLVLFFLILKNKTIEAHEKHKIKICLISFVVINTIYLIFIGKHYESRYSLPMIAFGYGFLAIFYDWLLKFSNKYLLFTVLGMGFGYVVWKQQLSFREGLVGITNDLRLKKELINTLEQEKNAIILHFYPNSSKEYALSFGVSYAGDMRTNYDAILLKKYPNYLEYNIWNQWCYQWGRQVSIEEILAQKKRVLLVGGRLENPIKIKKNDSEFLNFSVKIIRENGSGEYIYELIY
jgi:hypothetical protein